MSAEHVAVAGEGVGDGIEGEHEGDPVVVVTAVERSVGQENGDAGVLLGAGFDGHEEGEMAAARMTGEPDLAGVDLELARIRARPAHARRHIRAPRRVLMVRALAEIERDHDDAAGGEPAPVQDTVGPIESRPGAAVHVDERGEGRGRLPFGAIDARLQLQARGPGKEDVALLDFVGTAGIEANGHGHLLMDCGLPRDRRRRAPRSSDRTDAREPSERAPRLGSVPPPRIP